MSTTTTYATKDEKLAAFVKHVTNEEIVVEADARAQRTTNGTWVEAWLWISNDELPKRPSDGQSSQAHEEEP